MAAHLDPATALPAGDPSAAAEHGPHLAPLPAGGVFYPTREAIPVAEEVVIEVSFPELADRMLLRGHVAWRRPGRHREKIRAGVGIVFDVTEKPKDDYLLEVARGIRKPGVSARRHKRLPVSLSVSWRTAGGALEERRGARATLDDIGPGGAFLRSEELEPEGTPVVLELLPPGAQVPLSIEGRVAWTAPAPVSAMRSARPGPSGGFGVEFRIRDTGGIRRIKEIVRRLAAV